MKFKGLFVVVLREDTDCACAVLRLNPIKKGRGHSTVF